MVQTRAQRQASGGSSEGLADEISSPTITRPDLVFRAESLSPVMKLSPSQGLAALSAGLARRLADEHANSNLVFSPLSIYVALALVAAGARGATLDEILGVLGAQSRQEVDEFVARAAGDALRDQSRSGGPRVAFACGVWSDQSCPLKPGFREAVVAGAYGAEASTVDFHGDPNSPRKHAG
jgi:serpin B